MSAMVEWRHAPKSTLGRRTKIRDIHSGDLPERKPIAASFLYLNARMDKIADDLKYAGENKKRGGVRGIQRSTEIG